MSSHGRRTLSSLAAVATVAALIAPGASRADTVDASSTTLLYLHDQPRAGSSVTVAPAYELLSISARDIRNPWVDDLQVVFSGWGAVNLADDYVWYDRTPPEDRAFGDLDVAYVQAELGRRTLQLRLGRQLVAGGVVGSLQLDGGNLLLRLPWGFAVSAFAGAPVSQRFQARDTMTSFNPQGGTLAAGGRASWTLVPWGEVGASYVQIEDHGDPSRQQVGGDLRVTPCRTVTLRGDGNYDLYESRWAEVRALAQWQPSTKLGVSADYRHVEPDLLLARNSIMAIFTVEKHYEAGGGAQYGPWKAITFTADYHYLWEDSGRGDRARAGATWRSPGGTTAGAELTWLSFDSTPSGSYLNNGYFMARAFGSRAFGPVSATLDLQETALQEKVNGEQNSFVASATVAYALGHGFTALLAGSGAATPYFSSRYDLLAKVAYNQTYRVREVH